MLNSVNELRSFRIDARDGRVGVLDDVYFDDDTWKVRYLVADTGGWLAGRRVLIAPAAIMMIDPVIRQLRVDLGRKQIEDSPGVEAHKPVSRQHEADLAAYYGWPCYWNVDVSGIGPGLFTPPDFPESALPASPNASADSHLRSAKELVGYHIHATDGRVGHAEDFLVDGEDWQIRHIVADTRNWLPGRRVLISPRTVTGIDWADKEITVDMARQAIKDSPTYDPATFLVSQRHEEVAVSEK